MYTIKKNNTSPLCILCMLMPQIIRSLLTHTLVCTWHKVSAPYVHNGWIYVDTTIPSHIFYGLYKVLRNGQNLINNKGMWPSKSHHQVHMQFFTWFFMLRQAKSYWISLESWGLVEVWFRMAHDKLMIAWWNVFFEKHLPKEVGEREGIKACDIRAYLSFVKHKSLKIIHGPKVFYSHSRLNSIIPI